MSRRWISSSQVLLKNSDEAVNPNFINRNPRNLEQMGIAHRRKGWNFQYPTRYYYHRLMFSRQGKYIKGWVEHSSGKTVLSASAGEVAIAKHLYSTDDVSAAINVGRVLAQRCRESGITCMIPLAPEGNEQAPKYQAFLNAMTEGGVEMSEPEEVLPEYVPGIDYDDSMEYGDLKRRQQKAGRRRPVRWGKSHDNWI